MAVGDPKQLAENEGTVYLGAKPDSLGFVLDVSLAKGIVPLTAETAVPGVDK